MANKTIRAAVVIDKATERILFFEELLSDQSQTPIPTFPGQQSRFIGNVTFDQASGFDVNSCIHFKIDTATGMIAQVADDTDIIMVDAALWNHKFQISEALMTKISAIRRHQVKPLFGQAEVYRMKAEQARGFRRSGYTDITAFPMVADYAEVSGKPPRQAADQILRRARESAAILRRTEKARLVFKNSIFRATSFEDLTQVADNIGNLTLG